MRIAIYGRLLDPGYTPFLQHLIDELNRHDISVMIHENFYSHVVNRVKFPADIATFNTHQDIRKKIDYLFSIGGDGTLLDTITLVKDSGIPIIGVNTGRLGFLASIRKEELERAIKAIINRTYVLDKRTLVHLDANKPLFEGENFALNEFTIHKKDASAMIVIHTYINGELLNSYWADGLIVATPTGSTAYSLSCGGPIIFPTSKNFVITPVAPHNLNVRPIIVSQDVVVSFEIEGRSENFLCTMDSRHATIDSSFQLAVRKADFNINLLKIDEIDFLPTLRSKMMWGVDQRN